MRSSTKSQPRQRSEVIRDALKDAIREREYEQIREAYLRQPDSCSDADDWSNAEEWKAEVSRNEAV